MNKRNNNNIKEKPVMTNNLSHIVQFLFWSFLLLTPKGRREMPRYPKKKICREAGRGIVTCIVKYRTARVCE